MIRDLSGHDLLKTFYAFVAQSVPLVNYFLEILKFLNTLNHFCELLIVDAAVVEVYPVDKWWKVFKCGGESSTMLYTQSVIRQAKSFVVNIRQHRQVTALIPLSLLEELKLIVNRHLLQSDWLVPIFEDLVVFYNLSQFINLRVRQPLFLFNHVIVKVLR